MADVSRVAVVPTASSVAGNRSGVSSSAAPRHGAEEKVAKVVVTDSLIEANGRYLSDAVAEERASTLEMLPHILLGFFKPEPTEFSFRVDGTEIVYGVDLLRGLRKEIDRALKTSKFVNSRERRDIKKGLLGLKPESGVEEIHNVVHLLTLAYIRKESKQRLLEGTNESIQVYLISVGVPSREITAGLSANVCTALKQLCAYTLYAKESPETQVMLGYQSPRRHESSWTDVFENFQEKMQTLALGHSSQNAWALMAVLLDQFQDRPLIDLTPIQVGKFRARLFTLHADFQDPSVAKLEISQRRDLRFNGTVEIQLEAEVRRDLAETFGEDRTQVDFDLCVRILSATYYLKMKEIYGGALPVSYIQFQYPRLAVQGLSEVAMRRLAMEFPKMDLSISFPTEFGLSKRDFLLMYLAASIACGMEALNKLKELSRAAFLLQFSKALEEKSGPSGSMAAASAKKVARDTPAKAKVDATKEALAALKERGAKLEAQAAENQRKIELQRAKVAAAQAAEEKEKRRAAEMAALETAVSDHPDLTGLAVTAVSDAIDEGLATRDTDSARAKMDDLLSLMDEFLGEMGPKIELADARDEAHLHGVIGPEGLVPGQFDEIGDQLRENILAEIDQLGLQVEGRESIITALLREINRKARTLSDPRFSFIDGVLRLGMAMYQITAKTGRLVPLSE